MIFEKECQPAPTDSRGESGYYSTRLFYDKLGRPVVSQNTKQFNHSPKNYSYTLYDELGRIK